MKMTTQMTEAIVSAAENATEFRDRNKHSILYSSMHVPGRCALLRQCGSTFQLVMVHLHTLYACVPYMPQIPGTYDVVAHEWLMICATHSGRQRDCAGPVAIAPSVCQNLCMN